LGLQEFVTIAQDAGYDYPIERVVGMSDE